MPRTITVQIPEGTEPGDTLAFCVDGTELELQVPIGTIPGDAFEIQIGDDAIMTEDQKQHQHQQQKSDGALEVLLANGKTFQLLVTIASEGDTINDDDSNDDNNDGTYAMAWPAGQEMVRCMDELVLASRTSKRIVELGSGLGLVGLSFAASYVGTDDCHIVLTDTFLPLLELNLLRNKHVLSQKISVECQQLIWGRKPTTTLQTPFDLILASDVLYNIKSISSFVKTVQELLIPQGGTIIIAVRWRKPEQERDFFVQTTTTMGMTWHLHPSFCPLTWNEYGNPASLASNQYFSQTMIAVQGQQIPLADIDEELSECMTEEEYQAWEKAQIQIYIGTR